MPDQGYVTPVRACCRIGSMMVSNTSAWAGGAAASGVIPAARNTPKVDDSPIARRRALFLRDRRFRLLFRPAIVLTSPAAPGGARKIYTERTERLGGDPAKSSSHSWGLS